MSYDLGRTRGHYATSSATCNNTTETARGAFDGSTSTKWCSNENALTSWLLIDLGQPCRIESFTIRHAESGGEAAGLNTKDFDIIVSNTKPQPYNRGGIVPAVQVRNNTSATTTHTPATTAIGRWVMLNVLVAVSEFDHTRIYGFEIYGTPVRRVSLTTIAAQGGAAPPPSVNANFFFAAA